MVRPSAIERKPRYLRLSWDSETGEIDMPAGWKLHQVHYLVPEESSIWCVVKDANF
jgi:hypothetical protein